MLDENVPSTHNQCFPVPFQVKQRWGSFPVPDPPPPQKINKPNYLVGGSNPQPLGPEVRRPTYSTMLVVPYLPNPSPLGWPLSVTLSLYACTCLNLVWSSDSRNHYDNWLSGRHFRVFVTAAPKKKKSAEPLIHKQTIRTPHGNFKTLIQPIRYAQMNRPKSPH